MIKKAGNTLRVAARTAEQHVGQGWEVERSDKRGAAAWERYCARRRIAPWPPKKTVKKKKNHQKGD